MERQQSSCPIEEEIKQPTLIQLNAEYQRVAHELIEIYQGELTPEVEAELTRTENALCMKIDGYGFVEKEFELRAEYWAGLEKEAADQKRKYQNALKRMKERLKYVLSQITGEKLLGRVYGYRLQKGRPSRVIDEALLPDEYKKAIQEVRVIPDEEKIEAALKENKTIPGVTVTPTKALYPARPK
jgi:hypothetical protein